MSPAPRSDSNPAEAPQNPLHERYASREMAALFTAGHRFRTWRRLWIALAEAQHELGLPIGDEQLAALRAAADDVDLARVAELERQTRHDVVAHLRHFAEQAGDAGGILHLGATSAFVTDNTDVLIARDALELVARRLAAALRELAAFARRHAALPCLAYTHFQPAQLTTVGKRAALWIQDLALDLDEVDHRLATLRCRGAKGTTGTQASFLTLFDGDGARVRELDRRVAAKLGFAGSFPVTGQTYPRKQDSRVLAALAGVAESCHKLGTDLRLLQGVGELSEPFDDTQVGSSAMAYKRNPVRAERMCGLARRLITDSLERPAERRHPVARALARRLGEPPPGAPRRLPHRRRRALPRRPHRRRPHRAPGGGGGARRPRAALHGHRDHPDAGQPPRRRPPAPPRAPARPQPGGPGSGRARRRQPADGRHRRDSAFGMDRAEIDALVDPRAFTGRSEQQVEELLSEVVEPLLARHPAAEVEAPRV